MTLIKSISGIRGTIGGNQGEGLTPVDVVKYSAAFGAFLKRGIPKTKKPSIVIGRDARISGAMVRNLVTGTLQGLGFDVIDCGLASTPTVEMAVSDHKADGGIIITASHNPKNWNALKLLNQKGEFISSSDGEEVLNLAEAENFVFSEVAKIGGYSYDSDATDRHIEKILKLSLVDVKAIRSKKFKVVLDAVNSVGGMAVPKLLNAIGVEQVVLLNGEPTGEFAHNPEPLPEHLTDLCREVRKSKAHLGISVDPDVDRLALICEDGEPFGEEYTLVAIADYVLRHTRGNTVSNLSSTRALKVVTEKNGGKYAASAVGEVNVVEMMKSTKAVIGGEGNGGVIYPELHYGRDALAGIALFLTHLAKFGKSCSMLREQYPDYYISKNKIEISAGMGVDEILKSIRVKYKKEQINLADGVKIDFEREWVHLRKSNTEPIIRIYAESQSQTTAANLAGKIMADIREIIKERKK